MRGRNLFCLYPEMLEMLSRHGVKASPRHQPVIEMQEPTMWTIRDSSEWAMFIPGRKFNPFFALAEVLWMWSGKGGADFIQFYNKSIVQFKDDDIPYFHGSYGKRIRHAGYSDQPFRSTPYVQLAPGPQEGPRDVEVDQLIQVIGKLKADPETRQGVVSLWDPIKDNWVKSKDHPCNNVLYFWIRDEALHMTIVRRSNDLVWGVPYNMCQFSHLHALMAGSLDVAIGRYHVIANNLHFYTELYPDTLNSALGWASNVLLQGVDLSKMSTTFYEKTPDMMWGLDKFTSFVEAVWDPFEKQSRNYIDNQLVTVYENANSVDHAINTISAYYYSWLIRLEEEFRRYHVPDYWQGVFTMLLAYHCKKAKAESLFNDLILRVPRFMRWLVTDFYTKGE